MWSAVSFIVLVQVYLLGTVLEAGPVGHHRQGPIREARRPDYTYTAGAGAHKIFAQMAGWNTARRTCIHDGAHLVIINSVAEAEAVVQLLNSTNSPASHVGVHDLYEEDEFVTIHGEPLAWVGYNVWRAGEPNNGGEEDCVAIFPDAALNDIPCSYRTHFVCELPDIQIYELQDSQLLESTTFSPEVLNIFQQE